MKKLLVAGFCLLGALCFMQAQNVDWKNYGAGIEEGDFIVRGDIGFSRHWKSLPYDGSMKVPYLEASVEYTKKINELPFGFGGFIGYSQDKMKETASVAGWVDAPDIEWKGEMNYINLGALANYHIQVPVEKLDLYAGLRVGLEFWNWKVDYKQPVLVSIWGNDGSLDNQWYETKKESIKENGTNFYAGINFGASYFFTEKFGANIEVGYPSLIKIGGTAKF